MAVHGEHDRTALLLCVEKYDPKTLSSCSRIRGQAFEELARAKADTQRMHEEVEKLGFAAEHLSDLHAGGMKHKVAQFLRRAVRQQSKIQAAQAAGETDRKQVRI